MMECSCDHIKSDGKMLLLSGTSNVMLSEAIAQHFSLKLGEITIKTFNDGELNIEIAEDIIGRNVFIIQSTNTPVNDNIMQLLLLISTCKAYGANSITAIIPYFGYSRQDRKMFTVSPVSASTVSNLIKSAGVNTVVTVDIHDLHIISFFAPEVFAINIDTQDFVSKEFLSLGLDNPVIVSPDAGGICRARAFADSLNKHGLPCSDMAIIIKYRTIANHVSDMTLVGDVKGRHVLIIDDIIDTAGTLVMAAQKLKDQGATKIICFATHGVFSSPVIERIASSPLDAIYITDTIYNHVECEKIKTISIVPLIAQTIATILN
ncbi:ribose-phosphate pyrophosphokinase [Babesia microti strain RI]|uniref:ribose-phosphate diphosphokinase n=1 Tax=Babesia microti (strain RI) TaxID=1133968 RepID=A0A0K3AQ14_BABMR|nr:ribose-phosphate pyrophosphokinase [Babesia microti strain RI]CTQ40728.1 ribose-phosphate pyrophosphokinase [Babesia microti strain RI]|eukprot:XP_012648739.1 ribose-phosphate pyrophosphokinase [Babesia microti strain RI]